MRYRSICLAVVVALGSMLSLTVAASAQAPQAYRVLDRWRFGGTGGWDYMTVDAGAHRLYLTHGNRVEVIDTGSGKPLGAVTGLQGTHGVVLDPDGKVGYISDGRANAVVVFDRRSFDVLARIPAGTNPDGMAYEPATKTVWAFNGRSNNVTVVDTSSKTAVSTINLPGRPEFPQADGRGHVFDNLEDKNSIVELDARSRSVLAVWPLEDCESPSGMAIDPRHHRLFSVCDGGKMAIVDTDSGKEIATASIGAGPDAAGYSEKRELAFSSNGGDGTLSVVDARHGYKTQQTVLTQKGARTMAYDPSTDRVYVVTAEFGPRPAATAENPHPRPSIVPDSFTVLVVGH